MMTAKFQGRSAVEADREERENMKRGALRLAISLAKNRLQLKE